MNSLEGDKHIDFDSTSYQDIKISFHAVSMEADIDLSLKYSDGKWNIVGKYGHVYSVSPSMTSVLEADDVEEQLTQFFEAELAKNPRKAMGLDGTTYTFEISRGMQKDEYEWWVYLPKEWGAIGNLVESLYIWVGYSGKIEVLEEDF